MGENCERYLAKGARIGSPRNKALSERFISFLFGILRSIKTGFGHIEERYEDKKLSRAKFFQDN